MVKYTLNMVSVSAMLSFGILVSSFAFGQELPNRQTTPGVAIPEVTRQQICRPGYSGTVRNVPSSVKRQVYEEYNYVPKEGVCSDGCEVDHLISLELGGANDLRNLWPQPYGAGYKWNAHVKDKLENELHRRVCKGDLDMHDAQQMEINNWIQAYKDTFPDDPLSQE